MHDNNYRNSGKKESDKQALIENISKMVLSLLPEGQQNLDSLECDLTAILDNIRKKTTEQYFQSKNPDVHCCVHCGEKMDIKENLSRTIVGLVQYEIKRRSFYCSSCKRYERPLDKILKLSGRFSLEIRTAMVTVHRF